MNARSNFISAFLFQFHSLSVDNPRVADSHIPSISSNTRLSLLPRHHPLTNTPQRKDPPSFLIVIEWDGMIRLGAARVAPPSIRRLPRQQQGRVRLKRVDNPYSGLVLMMWTKTCFSGAKN